MLHSLCQSKQQSLNYSIQITPVNYRRFSIDFSSQRLISHSGSASITTFLSLLDREHDRSDPLPREVRVFVNNNFNGPWPHSFHSPWFSSSLAPKLAYDTPYTQFVFSLLSVNNWKVHSSLVLSWGNACLAGNRSGIALCLSWRRFR